MDISFVRGDTFSFKVNVSLYNKKTLTFDDIESIFITVRKEPTSLCEIIFQKNIDDITFENGYINCTFLPQDTQNLPYGKYYFDIEITLKNGYRKSKLYNFTITEETTIHEEN